MIKRLNLTNYRNLRLGDGIEFDPLTILIGPNGCGKTNLIRALQFLQETWTFSGNSNRGMTGFEIATGNLGWGRVLSRLMEYSGTVGLELDFNTQPEMKYHFGLSLDVRELNDVSVRGEFLRETTVKHPNGRTYYDVDLAEGHIEVSRGKPSNGSESVETYPIKELPRNELLARSVQSWLEQFGDEAPTDTPLFGANRMIREFMGDFAFYDGGRLSVRLIRSGEISEMMTNGHRLDVNGGNLAPVIHGLMESDLDVEEQMVGVLTELYPRTRTLKTRVDIHRRIWVEWFQKGMQKPITLDELSDGTIRMLCWATILLAPELPRLIVLDEPELGIHPAWLRVLAGWITDAARKTQVILSTHSPDLLDYFTGEATCVRVFEEDTENPLYQRVVPLSSDAIKEKLAEGWHLGDLYRVGDPSIGGWPW